MIIISFLLLLGYFIYNKENSADYSGWLNAALIAVLALFAQIPGGWWIKNIKAISAIQILSSLLLIPGLGIVIWKKNISKNITFVFVFFLIYAFILRIIMVFGSPDPAIDVYVILKEAPIKLLSGINPYQSLYTYVFPQITPDYYAYWPASFLLQIPIIFFLKDPRYLLLFADLVSAVILFILGGKNQSSLILSLLYLFRPLSLAVIEASWLTPLNFLFLAAIVFFLKKSPPKAKYIAGVLTGILTSIQFFFALFFVFLIRKLNFNRKFLFSYMCTVILFVLPFFLINPVNFYYQTIDVYFKNPPHPSILIHTSLNLNTLYYVITGRDLPLLLTSGIYLAVIFLTLKRIKSLEDSILGFTLTLLTIFVFGRQAFVNYYYLISSLLLLYLSLKLESAKD